MTTTTFTAGTVVASSWLNDVDEVVYGLRTHMGVAPYAADPTGVVSAHTVLQAALDAGKTNIYFPPGTYLFTAGVTVASSKTVAAGGTGYTAGVYIHGDDMNHTIFQGSGTYNAMITLGTVQTPITDSGQLFRGGIEKIRLTGLGATIQYGIYGSNVEEHNFTEVAAWYFKSAGMSIGYGYVNNYTACDLSYNTGHGLQLNTDFGSGGNNINNINKCVMLANTKFGIYAKSGYSLRSTGNTIEQNTWGGIYLEQINAVYISDYFESNSSVGYTFTTPAVTIKSDIIFNGDTYPAMSAAFPCTGAVVESCHTTSGIAKTSFVYNAGVVDLMINGIHTDTPANIPLVAEQYNPAYKGYNVSITNCSNFTTQVSILNATVTTNNTFAAYYKIDDPASKVANIKNYAETDLNTWGVVAASNAITYRRSTNTALYSLYGNPVWEMLSGITGSSSIYGKSVVATDYPELVGKTVWFGAWVYATSAQCFAVPYCDEQTFNVNPTTLNTWVFVANSFTWPASGNVVYGMYKSGTDVAGSVYFSSPMLAVLGAPCTEVIPFCAKPEQAWRGSAAPTTGTWPVSAVVWNTAPASGGTPGWVCTTAPNTFKAMANLA
jgi:hypothetical protein